MNTDTGIIRKFSEPELVAARAIGERLVEILDLEMTDKQRKNMAVSLHDTRSTLGRRLHEERSKYLPHIGAKQQKRMARQVAKS